MSGPLDPDRFFREDYRQSRAEFLSAARRCLEQGDFDGRLEVLSTDARRDLTTDACLLLPRSGMEQLLIVTSGLHGVEGIFGGCVQRYVMHLLAESPPRRLGVLFVHALNPYGFDQRRRTNADNIDLNRTFDSTGSLFAIENPGYEELHDLVAPERAVTADDLAGVEFARELEERLQGRGNALSAAVVSGQYRQPRGIYYGGRSAAAEAPALLELLESFIADVPRTLAIDLHTGFGRRGVLHLFPDVQTPERRQAVEAVFQDWPIDWADSEGFYSVTGEFVTCLAARYSEREFVPMIFEYGTLDSQTPEGHLQSLHRLVLENQLYHHGAESPEVARQVSARYLELFCPDDPEWRRTCLEQTGRCLDAALRRFADEELL